MKRISVILSVFLFVTVILLNCTAACAASAAAETPERTTALSAHCATVGEGQELMRNRKLFHEQINEKEMAFLLQKKGGTLEEYIVFSAEQVLAFTPEEEQQINETMIWLQNQLEKHGLKLPDPGPITFVKTTGQEASGAAGYTSGGSVFLADAAFSRESFRDIIVHEISHCLSRLFPEYRQALYSLIHFTVLDHEIDIPQDIRDQIIANPDVEHHNSTATFTINGEKTECYLLFLSDSVFEKPGDDFFDGMYTGIVPTDGSKIYRTDEVEDFWDIVGRNTEYAEDPEEIMASNFALAMLHLDDGYDSYPNPEILEGIVSYLKAAD